MREASFVKQNTPRWQQFEEMLISHQASNPDQLAELFVQLTDDLSYARTHYPNSQTTLYLNNLTAKVHQSIYRNKKEDKGRLIRFWKEELPLLMYASRKQLLYSFLIFFISVIIGAVSAAHDDRFVRLILGDGYVEMTLDNIEKGDPMGIYKQEGETLMFLAITKNNIMVSFITFVWGGFQGIMPVFLLLSFGTGISLVNNGIMLGAFQYFFYQKGLLLESALTIWIHGTLEISAIIIAGCAGIVMGNAVFFPGTYTRMESFKRGAMTGMKIAVGIVPIFIVAGFLEGFVTRHTEMPIVLKLAIILTSAFFIAYYFVIYPMQLHKKQLAMNIEE
ncbi:stage II sporulation protein M [Xanthocytophaga agilis]|uniref:Stage II sporulation protein M n=1 Tax=Xanthocytophaga agilis TaxID=3048010 RepID=A0AAE3UH37_9BACT|nr:stage II sporulation protein M [Xanthocytophaga agilis]MDJ1503941.1 stage II sporulation protein M [Xanthocytophaga agilis]